MRRLLLLAAMLIELLPGRSAAAEELLIIANPSIAPAAPLSLRQVAAIYLLRTTFWRDGTHIVPVNREATSEIRARFVSAVLREDNETLGAYWNEMHFQGKEPPVVQESDAAMLAFVRKVPGAIGYVSASTPAVGVSILCHVPE